MGKQKQLAFCATSQDLALSAADEKVSHPATRPAASHGKERRTIMNDYGGMCEVENQAGLQASNSFQRGMKRTCSRRKRVNKTRWMGNPREGGEEGEFLDGGGKGGR